MAKVKQLCEALSIIKVAVENLCKEDRDLLQAERVVMFTINKLQELKSAISGDLLERFQIRIAERRDTRVIHLLEYLTNPDFIFKGVDQFGIAINKPEITKYAIAQIRRLYPDVCIESNDEEVETESEDDDSKRLNLAQELEEYIKKKSNVQSSGAVGVSLDLYVKRAMAL